MTQMPPTAPGPAAYQNPNPQQSTGLAVGSVICGVLSIVLSFFVCLWFLAVPLGVVAVILAMVARGKIARGEASGAGLAKAGLITGIIGIILSVVITAAISLFFRAAGNTLKEQAERMQREAERMQQEAAKQQQQQQRQPATTQPSAPGE